MIPEDIEARAFSLTVRIVMAPLLGLLLLAFILWHSAAYSRTLYPGQWAQVDPAERDWLRTQKVPGQNYRCCDESDGTYAEEDLRDGHYWTRFTWRHYGINDQILHDVQSDWMQVPDDAVIHDPNRHGSPVVWWSWQGGYGDQAKVFIRCYAPGGGA